MGQSTDAFARTTVTITSGQSVSELVNLEAKQLLGIGVVVPATWTAADIGFEVSSDGGSTWIPVYNAEGERVLITGIDISAQRLYIAPAEAWVIGAFKHVRLVSLNTSTGAAVNQGAGRSLVFVRLSS